MAIILKDRKGNVVVASGGSATVEPLGHDLYVRQGPPGPKGGGDYYVKESVAANGDVTYRWLRFEPSAK